jgi:hypothetical protein
MITRVCVVVLLGLASHVGCEAVPHTVYDDAHDLVRARDAWTFTPN